jgi:N,N'-diacetyllegionaminate synthase
VSVLYVAEMGSQHKGNVSLACEYARVFKEAGADILKMQFGHSVGDPIRYVSADMAETMQRYCLSIGLELMASIFSPDGLALARHVGMKRYKVAHQMEAENVLIKTVLEDGKETFISHVGRLQPFTATYKNLRNVFTTDTYPTYPWALQVPADFSNWYGYSDHTHGVGACLLAVARGARYIEKHVCLDKTDLWTKDTSFSATPAEFAELVRLGREIERVRDVAL